MTSENGHTDDTASSTPEQPPVSGHVGSWEVVIPSGSGIVPANGVEIAYETFGDRADRPLLGGMIAQTMAARRPELLIIPGMGHDLPRPVWPALADAICALAGRPERR